MEQNHVLTYHRMEQKLHSTALNGLLEINFKNTKNPFNNNELMLHRRWNKSGQGIQQLMKLVEFIVTGICDANGIWDNFMKITLVDVMQDMGQETPIPLLYILKLFRLRLSSSQWK